MARAAARVGAYGKVLPSTIQIQHGNMVLPPAGMVSLAATVGSGDLWAGPLLHPWLLFRTAGNARMMDATYIGGVMNGAAFLRTIGATCWLALAVAGCGSSETGPVEVETARSQAVRVLDPQVSADDVATLAADNAAFAFAAYGKLKTATDNLVFSPASISLALAMAYAGAAGDTAAEMATALRFSLPPERLHPAFNALDLALAARGAGALGADGGPMRLRIVNSAWGERTYVFRGDYLDTLAINYGAGVNLVDFIGAPEQARRLINDWVAQQTEDKIRLS